MVIVILEKRYWLWRVADNEGTALDFLIQSLRDAKAGKKLMRRLLKKQKLPSALIMTDKPQSYHAAFRDLSLTADHADNKRANNKVEN